MVFINNYNEFLAQTRLRQGRDFDELSISSGVAVSHLKAIEKANTHPFYSRAYYERCVMKYAGVLGVDEEIVLKQPEQSELAFEPGESKADRATPARVSLADEDGSPPPLPAELFASRGPLVPPQTLAPKPDPSAVNAKPVAGTAKPANPEPAAPSPTSLDEILPPKLDMTPPKAGFGFPVFLVAIGVALAVGVLAWQQVHEEGIAVESAQQADKSQAGTQESKVAEPAVPATPAPVVDPSQQLRAEVERDLALWAKAWSDRNAAVHLSFFDSTFPEFRKYADNRRKRIAAAQSIEVSVSDVVIEKISNEEFATRFVQSYRSDTLTSKDTKELIWKKTPSGMKIVSERVLK